MANEFFTKSGYPGTRAAAVSASLRAEIAAIEAGFDKLPALSGNGGEIIAVNSGATGLEAITTTGTGSGVRATSPTLVTPALGVATATSINGVAITGSGTIASGGGIAASAYTPTLANVLNTSSRTLNGAWYMRVGGFALVFIQFSATGSSAGQAVIDTTLPFTPDVSATVDVIGAGGVITGGDVKAVAVSAIISDKAQITWMSDGGLENAYVLLSFRV